MRMRSGTITWTHEDDADTLELELEFNYTPGYAPTWNDYWGGDPGCGPEIEFTAAHVTNVGDRVATADESKLFGDWFLGLLERRPALLESLTEKACEEMNQRYAEDEADYPDPDDD